jgi:2-oxoglutarate dehydrogenase complex dehydrogenase (E1) component-like enzyme
MATPKIGLKHPLATSKMDDFAPGKRFQPILVDKLNDAKSDLVVLCSGKVYFDIMSNLKDTSRNIRVIRVEEIAPFPSHQIELEL